jgi:hypothetical protein
MTFDEVTGRMSGTPALSDLGDHIITLRATDEVQSDEQTFTVSVLTNVPPTFSSTPLLTVQEGTTYQYEVTVDDDYNYALAAVTLPAWLTFDSATEMLSGAPANADVGNHVITLSATDEIQTVEQNFSVTVTARLPRPQATSGGGGGSMGIFLLFLLGVGIRRRFT